MSNILNKKAILSTAVALTLASGVTSCASAYKEESTGQFIDSSVITTKVKSKLLADKHINGLPITVKTYKNTVLLSGFVNTKAQEEHAVQLAKSVEGVNNVEDSIVVKNH